MSQEQLAASDIQAAFPFSPFSMVVPNPSRGISKPLDRRTDPWMWVNLSLSLSLALTPPHSLSLSQSAPYLKAKIHGVHFKAPPKRQSRFSKTGGTARLHFICKGRWWTRSTKTQQADLAAILMELTSTESIAFITLFVPGLHCPPPGLPSSFKFIP